MNVWRTVSAAACLTAVFAARADELGSAQAVAILLNSRTSTGSRLYVQAAEKVAAEAASGAPLQQFVMAVTAMRVRNAATLPPAARLDKATIDGYIAASKPKIVEMAEKRNNAAAWYLLAVEGDDMEKLEHAAKLGSVQALNALGTIVASSAPERARGLFERAAQCGDANGLYNLGACLAGGIGGAGDGAKALECFVRAAEKGHPEAMEMLAKCYGDGACGTEKDSSLALLWLVRSRAAKGDANAEKWLESNGEAAK